ncbi:hypothetical protein EDB89DRAFT_2080085 [Lactarius sanguifluus]|nr:hypothetical protein EDB89DRAFT_2080085 [Lactarius sanguifluus]
MHQDRDRTVVSGLDRSYLETGLPNTISQPLQPGDSHRSSPIPSLLPSPSPTAIHTQSPSPAGYIPTRPPSRQDQTQVQEDRDYDRYLLEEHCPLNQHITYGSHLTVTHDKTLPAEEHSPVSRSWVETPPPHGYQHNRGVHYIPFQIRDAQGWLHPARYMQLVFTVDPFVLAYRQGSNQQYGKSVHAAPDYDNPSTTYTDDNLIFLDQNSSYWESVDAALLGMKDLSAGYTAKEEELQKKRANAIKRIKDERDSYLEISGLTRDPHDLSQVPPWAVDYPLDAIYHKVHLYLNERVASPYCILYIIDHPTWDDLELSNHPPIGITQGEDLHGYKGLGGELFPVFHANLLMPYKETELHGANFTRPPPDLIKGEEEFKPNSTVPLQEAGVPVMGYDVAHTPHSHIFTPPPLPEFILDPDTSLPTIHKLAKSPESTESTSPPLLVSPPTLSTLYQTSLLLPPFLPGINHVFTPIPTVELTVPD